MGSFLRNIHPLLNRNRNERNYDGANYAILNAVSEVLGEVEQEAMDSKMQSSLETATGEWLDTWGDWFGLPRKPKEDDEHYRARIIRYVLLKRGTIPAIKEAIKEFFDDPDANVEIYEPWRNIFYTNKSHLNGPDHLMGEYYRFAVIDITLDRPMDPRIAEVINKFKPAGVKWLVNIRPTGSGKGGEVEHPIAQSEVITQSALDKLTGVGYTLKCQVNPGDQFEDMEESNIFITNKSHLNGPDVLAGSHTHGRGEVHYVGIADKTYEPPRNANLFELRKGVVEVEQPYHALAEVDGLYLTHTPEEGQALVIAYNLKETLSSKYRQEYLKVTGETPENVDPKVYAEFFGDVTHNLVAKGLVKPGDSHKVSAEIFNYETNRWQVLTTEQLTVEPEPMNGPIGHLTNFIGDEGFLITRLISDTGVRLDVDLAQLSSRVRFPDGEELLVDQTVKSLTKQEKEWVAYADSPDGSVAFRTENPTGNLFKASRPEYTGMREFVDNMDWDMVKFPDRFGLDQRYDISFDVKTAKPSNRVQLYAQSGTGTRYSLQIPPEGNSSKQYSSVDTMFTSHEAEGVKLIGADPKQPNALLAFHTSYDSGELITVRNVVMKLSEPKYVGIALGDINKQPTEPSAYTWEANY